ncbi:PIG-L family deacetylase [Geomicrobium sp. JCM 19037]|uniref:PIG-L family deacetylase n=1 Tax=Geomicrobium sp. JCM 19037 TaxID=1460634 RepID=UPI002691F8D2
MGVDRLHHLGFRDKTLEFEQTEFLANTLRDLIEKEQPDLVITFDPELSIHPDHNATGRAVIQPLAACQSQPGHNCIRKPLLLML